MDLATNQTIGGAKALKAQHLGGELLGRQGLDGEALKLLADLVILAKDTAQVASGKENRSRTSVAGNGRFFPKMQTGMRHLNPGIDPANPESACQPVYLAVARTACKPCSSRWRPAARF